MASCNRRPLSDGLGISPPPVSTGTPAAGASVAATTFSNSRDWWLILFVFAAVFLAYQPVWHAGFIWDDNAHVTPPALRSLAGLGRIWFDLNATQQYYPLLHSAFWIEHWLWGDFAPGYHWVNLALHALNAIMAGLLLRRLRVPGAYLAACIFALHPVMVESVAWITELKNTLSGFFYLGAALAYLHFDGDRRRGWYGLALGLFVLALLSKTVTATLPGALLVVFWWQRGRLTWRRDVLPVLPFFVLGAAGGLFTAWVERKVIGAEGADFAFSLVERGLIAGRVIWFYLGKLWWPADLVFIYPRWTVSQAAWWQYLYPAGALLGLGLSWRLRGWSRGPLAGALFFIGTLFPVLGFFNVYPFVFSFVADHFQYLASLGVITLASAGAVRLSDRWRFWQPGTLNSLPSEASAKEGKPQTPNSKPLGAALGLMVLAALAGLTWRQSRMYSDAETLYRMTLVQNPGCRMAHDQLGQLLAQTGRMEEAIYHFEETLRINPNEARAHNSLGTALLASGRVEEAIGHYRQALRLKPDFAGAENNLGIALVQAGRMGEAEDHFEQAVRLNPDYAEAHNNLGGALMRAGRMAEAKYHFEQAVRLNPDYALARKNLARLRALRQPPSSSK